MAELRQWLTVTEESPRIPLDDITDAVSQTRVPGDGTVRDPNLPPPPMVVVTYTPPPERRTVFSPAKSPRRSPRRGYHWVPATPPPSNERSKSLSPVKSPPLTPFGCQSPGTKRNPRKKLVYFSEDEPNNPPTPKKVKFEVSPKTSPPLKATLHSLSNNQLITIIGSIVNDHPELQEKIVEMIPVPDLRPVESHIKHLRYCIHQALPRHSRSRLKSKTDAVAFSRTDVYVYNLKKYIFETGRTLERSLHWPVVVDFAIMAWNSVRMTPVWDTPIHNETKITCFNYLSKLMGRAVQEGTFSKDELIQIRNQTRLLQVDNTSCEELNANLEAQIAKEDNELTGAK